MRAEQLGIRVITIRTGIVLGKEGALAKMMFPFKMGVGRTAGQRQELDALDSRRGSGVALHPRVKDGSVRGPVNGTAPNPVINKDFTKAFAAALHDRRSYRFRTLASACSSASSPDSFLRANASCRLSPNARALNFNTPTSGRRWSRSSAAMPKAKRLSKS